MQTVLFVTESCAGNIQSAFSVDALGNFFVTETFMMPLGENDPVPCRQISPEEVQSELYFAELTPYQTRALQALGLKIPSIKIEEVFDPARLDVRYVVNSERQEEFFEDRQSAVSFARGFYPN